METDLTPETLAPFLRREYPDRPAGDTSSVTKLATELTSAGYTSIESVSAMLREPG
jgi:hypothetical protein